MSTAEREEGKKLVRKEDRQCQKIEKNKALGCLNTTVTLGEVHKHRFPPWSPPQEVSPSGFKIQAWHCYSLAKNKPKKKHIMERKWINKSIAARPTKSGWRQTRNSSHRSLIFSLSLCTGLFFALFSLRHDTHLHTCTQTHTHTFRRTRKVSVTSAVVHQAELSWTEPNRTEPLAVLPPPAQDTPTAALSLQPMTGRFPPATQKSGPWRAKRDEGLGRDGIIVGEGQERGLRHINPGAAPPITDQQQVITVLCRLLLHKCHGRALECPLMFYSPQFRWGGG